MLGAGERRSGRFVEVDSVPAAGRSLATCGPVVAVQGPEDTALFGVVGQRLEPLRQGRATNTISSERRKRNSVSSKRSSKLVGASSSIVPSMPMRAQTGTDRG